MAVARRRRPAPGERGSSQAVFILSAVTLVVVVGLVVDGAGKVQAAAEAQAVAASAARAATAAVAPDVVEGGGLRVDAARAEAVALEAVAQAGMQGTATVSGDAITVTASTEHDTLFLGLIGIASLPAAGTASASLLEGPAAAP